MPQISPEQILTNQVYSTACTQQCCETDAADSCMEQPRPALQHNLLSAYDQYVHDPCRVFTVPARILQEILHGFDTATRFSPAYPIEVFVNR